MQASVVYRRAVTDVARARAFTNGACIHHHINRLTHGYASIASRWLKPQVHCMCVCVCVCVCVVFALRNGSWFSLSFSGCYQFHMVAEP